MEPKELLDRYIAEVGNHLPEKHRSDIQQEIRSLLEDALEDRAQKKGCQADEDMIVNLLKEYGPPQRVAASYLPPQYLVGPSLYPHFLNAVRILALVVLIVILVTTALSLVRTDPNPVDAGLAILEGLGNLISGVLTGLGALSIAFWIIQRLLPENKQRTILKELEDWDPRKLEMPAPPESFKLGSLIAEIIVNLLAILIFNVYIDRVGLYTFFDGKWLFIPMLSAAFYSYLPWLTLLWALSILQCILVLRQGGWRPLTRGFAVALDIFTILLAFLMLVGKPLISFSSEALALFEKLNLDNITAAQAENGLVLLTRMILTIILAVTLVELVQPLYRKFIKNALLESPKL